MGLSCECDFEFGGDAFDIDTEDEDSHDEPLIPTNKKIVTCEKCKLVIAECRGVKTA